MHWYIPLFRRLYKTFLIHQHLCFLLVDLPLFSIAKIISAAFKRHCLSLVLSTESSKCKYPVCQHSDAWYIWYSLNQIYGRHSDDCNQIFYKSSIFINTQHVQISIYWNACRLIVPCSGQTGNTQTSVICRHWQSTLLKISYQWRQS